jgi:KDO2-lipid IV(A) lauroyltransferase
MTDQRRSNPQAIINGPAALRLVMFLGRIVPPGIGYRLVDRIADWISSHRKWELVQAVRGNQWVASRETLTKSELDDAVRRTFRNTGRCIYDLYHFLENNQESRKRVNFHPEIEAFFQGVNPRAHGVIAVSVHISNFDLAMQVAARMGFRAQAISLPNPGGGYQIQNDLRIHSGLEITPASKGAFRQALQRLERGGIVMTGIDRPIADSSSTLYFFGRPANLPVHHVQLAIKANVPIIVAGAFTRPDGVCEVDLTDPIPMVIGSDRRLTIIRNAQVILSIAEKLISRAPDQWSMFYPLWPEVLPCVP